MSNIFEIDGEIEDNFDENGDDKNSKKDKKKEKKKKDTPPIDNSSADESTANADKDESTTNDDTHWYDKYLPEEDGPENNSSSEDVSDEISAPVFEIENDEPKTEGDESDLPSVDDITQEEIDEVLAEIDEGEKELAASDFSDDYVEEEETIGQGEDEEVHESFDEIFPPRNKKPVAIGTWIFLTLFLISLTLLGYYQFYDGKSFSIDFAHRSSGNVSQLDSITEKYSAQVKELEDQQKIIEELTTKIQELNAVSLELAKDTVSESKVLSNNGTPAFEGVDLSKGTYYQVQLIALQQYHPSFGKSENAFYVDKENGYSKMLMGAFDDESQAKMLYEKVRKAGFNDAFIVKKENGKRVEYNPFE
ncbi:MAG: hypothetical protein JXQ87_10330 [Bacteroidia bacterium]